MLRILLFFTLLLLFRRCCTALSTITKHTWQWRGHPIAYYETNSHRPQTVLLLNGFGVGSFHQELLMQALEEFHIYAMDYLGQGDSWPLNCHDGQSSNEQGLCYSGNTWVEQIVEFIETNFPPQAKVHLVGNSVGGHLSVFVANCLPDRVASISLLNATPVWGLNLPGWSGHLPAPVIPKAIGRWAFDRMRDKNTIQLFLQNCYYNKDAFDETLVEQIHACTTGTGGHAAFASILWSPPITTTRRGDNISFRECLSQIQCPVLLLFGAQDPWCTPAIAQQILSSLPPEGAQYCELSNVGHCPNHEAPNAVAAVLQLFWKQPDKVPLIDRPWTIHERWGVTTVTQKQKVPLSWIEQQVYSQQN